jgi:hypothetical protein
VDAALTMGLGVAAMLLLLWVALRLRRSAAPAARASVQAAGLALPSGLTLRAQPLLTPAEAALYNLLKIAVQDQFLIFAQVPVWCLIAIHAEDRRQRAAFLNQVALKRVDFALVHPGSLTAAKIVEIEDAAATDGRSQARRRLMEAVCRAAGLELIRLDGKATYTVPELAAALGLAAEE